jgi:hypothetical protein
MRPGTTGAGRVLLAIIMGNRIKYQEENNAVPRSAFHGESGMCSAILNMGEARPRNQMHRGLTRFLTAVTVAASIEVLMLIFSRQTCWQFPP